MEDAGKALESCTRNGELCEVDLAWGGEFGGWKCFLLWNASFDGFLEVVFNLILLTMNFETNLKCDDCITKVTPMLDQLVGAGNWKVELSDPRRILRVALVDVHPKEIERGLASLGYEVKEV